MANDGAKYREGIILIQDIGWIWMNDIGLTKRYKSISKAYNSNSCYMVLKRFHLISPSFSISLFNFWSKFLFRVRDFRALRGFGSHGSKGCKAQCSCTKSNTFWANLLQRFGGRTKNVFHLRHSLEICQGLSFESLSRRNQTTRTLPNNTQSFGSILFCDLQHCLPRRSEILFLHCY